MCNHCSRLLFALVLLAGFLLPSASAQPAQADPVESLRKVLEQGEGLPESETPEGKKAAMEFGEKLRKQAAEVRSLAGLGQALLLKEWRSPNRSLIGADIMATNMNQLTDRFQIAARDSIGHGDARRRAALASLLSSMPDLVQGDARPHVQKMLVELMPDLLKLATPKDDVPAVALMLAKLGRLELPPPRKAALVTALAPLLTSAEVDISGRRAVASALESFVAVRVEESLPRIPLRAEILAMAVSVIPAAAGGLEEKDAEVRRRCLEVVHQSLLTLRHTIHFPDRIARIEEAQHTVQELEQLLPLFPVMDKALTAVRMRIGDEESAVRLNACQVVEALAQLRHPFLLIAASGLKVRDKPFEAPWGEGLRLALPGLEKNLADKEVRLRLAALYALEGLGAEAAPVSTSVLKGLTDESLFVRWGAVRVLGRIAPQAADKAVPALAERLTDESEDVRLTAALVLGRYGSSGKPAVPALTRAVEKGNAVLRMRAIPSLAAIGREANDCQPALILALSAADVEVRRAAAGALSRIGPLSEKALTALRKALADEDAEVRRAASLALLQGK